MTLQVNRRELLRYGAIGLGSIAFAGAVAGCSTSPTVAPTANANAAPANY